MQTEHIRTRFEKLGLSQHDAVIVGSGVLAALEIRESNDLDIITQRETFDTLAKSYSTASYPDGTGKIMDGDVEVMYSWLDRDYAYYSAHATEIDGFEYISLTELRARKLQQGRPKDLRDVVLIDEYLATHPAV